MFFLLRDKGRDISIPTPEYKVIQTDTGSVTVRNPMKRIIFKPLTGKGWKTTALPVKYGREDCEGYFDSQFSKMRPHVEEEEAIEFLMNHKDYGVDFIAINDDGKAILTLDEWETPAKRSEPYLTDSGEGKFCSLCEKQLDTRGLHKHLESKTHLDLLVAAEKAMVGSHNQGAAG